MTLATEVEGISLPHISDPPKAEEIREAFRLLEDLLTQIDSRLAAITVLQYEEEPKHLVVEDPEALLAWADGSSWDPGSGAGLYAYVNNSWTKV